MIHFLLAPDSHAAMRLRRLVAEEGARRGVVVGTWTDLLRTASSTRIHPPVDDGWSGALEEAVRDIDDAFWSLSLSRAPADAPSITALVGRHLEALLRSAGPGRAIGGISFDGVTARTRSFLRDLQRLHQRMHDILPPELAHVHALLDCPPDRVLKTVRVWRNEMFPLDPWQDALLRHLAAGDAESAGDASFAHIMACLSVEPGAPVGGALRFLQEHLFSLRKEVSVLKPSKDLQWLGVRDYLQEAEVVAGMVQQARKDDPSLTFADMAILLPDDRRYQAAVRSVFSRAGIPVSGLRDGAGIRDLGREAVLGLLLSLDRPAPVLALASLFGSPLMPWDMVEGNRLADEAVRLRFGFKPPDGSSSDAKAMLDLVRRPLAGSADLKRRLAQFPALLAGNEALELHRANAEGLCRRLAVLLEEKTGDAAPPWNELLALARPLPQAAPAGPAPSREGVAVFSEGSEPWRLVRRLFVLGCAEGHYPAPASGALPFDDEEVAKLSAAAGLRIEGGRAAGDRMRERFLRQLSSASEAVTFTVPTRDPLGEPVSPSASMTFASVLFGLKGGAEALVLDLESPASFKKAKGLPEKAVPDVPGRKLPEAADIGFDGNPNLLDVVPPGRDAPLPETPSKLETLMVSPLAWLLERLKVEPREWTPETLDVMVKGILAHRVFEKLFSKGAPVPAAEAVERVVPDLYGEALREICPFLLRREWKVERDHLQGEIVASAEEWARMLASMHARVLETEVPLKGSLDGLMIRGNADLLLDIPGRGTAVVDYKKSSSSGRRDRMKKGYDLQVGLYRTMLETGGKADGGTAGAAGSIGTMYYCMNDRVLLADTDGWLRGIGGAVELRGDLSSGASTLVGERLAELHKGHLRLNDEGDEERFAKGAGIKPYAFDRSPLIRLFMKPGKEEGGDK